MNRSLFHRGLILLAACALLLPYSLAKNPSRKIKATASGVITVNLSDQTYVASESGFGSHLGRFTGEYSGVINLTELEFVTAEGVTTSTNGDEIHWVLGSGPTVALFTGGTGRFEGVSGELEWEITDYSIVKEDFTGIAYIYYSYRASGWIAY